MVFLDVLYVGGATVLVMAVLHVLMYAVMRIAYPPEPKIIYRDVPVSVPPQQFQQQQQSLFQQNVGPVAVASHVPPPPPPLFGGPPPPAIETKKQTAFTEQKEEVQLPEYEPRIASATTSARLDAGLPDGLQETRPPGL